MARIKNDHRFTRSAEYLSARHESNLAGEDNDCFPTAVWIATGKPKTYKQILEMFAVEGRKPKKGTFNNQARAVLDKLGFTATSVPPQDFIRCYPGIHSTLKNVTTHHPDRFPFTWNDGKDYILFTRGHALAVTKGENHDHTRGKARRVRAIWRISKK